MNNPDIPEKTENIEPKKKKNLILILSFPVIIITLFIVLFLNWNAIWNIFKDAEALKQWVIEWGIWAPIIFIALQILQVIIFIIPGEVPQIAGGYLFGAGLGTLYSCIGIGIGSAVNFFLARTLGLHFIKHILSKQHMTGLEELANSSNARTGFFLLFLIPGIPKDMLCYVAGFSTMSFFYFMVVSSAGRLFGIVGSAFIGSFIAENQWVYAIIISVLAIILFTFGFIYKNKIEDFLIKRSSKKNDKN